MNRQGLGEFHSTLQKNAATSSADEGARVWHHRYAPPVVAMEWLSTTQPHFGWAGLRSCCWARGRTPRRSTCGRWAASWGSCSATSRCSAGAARSPCWTSSCACWERPPTASGRCGSALSEGQERPRMLLMRAAVQGLHRDRAGVGRPGSTPDVSRLLRRRLYRTTTLCVLTVPHQAAAPDSTAR